MPVALGESAGEDSSGPAIQNILGSHATPPPSMEYRGPPVTDPKPSPAGGARSLCPCICPSICRTPCESVALGMRDLPHLSARALDRNNRIGDNERATPARQYQRVTRSVTVQDGATHCGGCRATRRQPGAAPHPHRGEHTACLVTEASTQHASSQRRAHSITSHGASHAAHQHTGPPAAHHISPPWPWWMQAAFIEALGASRAGNGVSRVKAPWGMEGHGMGC